jgi:predicted DNA-binding transcriptional regulator AlpA
MNKSQVPDPNTKLLSLAELKQFKGISYSRTHLSRLERQGKFPRRVHTSVSRCYWIEAEVDQWIENLKSKRGV